MIKKLFSIILAMLLLMPSAVFADAVEPIINEIFDDSVTHAAPDSSVMTVSDGSIVVKRGESDKALFYEVAKGNGYTISMPVDATKVKDKMVFSIDLKITGGSVEGSIFSLGSGSSLLTCMSDKKVLLEDGYHIGGYGRWHTYTAAIDFSLKTYDFYLDGKKVLSKWKFKNPPTKPSEIGIMLIGMEGTSQISIDNIRFYEGEKPLPHSAFPKKLYNSMETEYVPTLQTETADQVYIDSYADKNLQPEFQLGNGARTNLAKYEYFEDTGVRYMYFKTIDKNGVYANLTTNAPQLSSFVYEVKVYPAVISTTRINIGRVYSAGAYSAFAEIQPDGRLTTWNATLTTLPMKEWSKIQVVVDLLRGTGDYYVNGKLVKKGLALQNGGKQPDTIRVGIESAQTVGVHEVYFDAIKLYSGKELKDFGDDKRIKALKDAAAGNKAPLNLNSIMDGADTAATILKNDSVFMGISDYYYTKGERKRYSDFGSAAYLGEEDVVMVPAPLVADAFDVDIKCDGTTITMGEQNGEVGKAELFGIKLDSATVYKDNMLYLPVHSFVRNVLGKYSYNDDRNFVIVSPDAKVYSNDPSNLENIEPSDVIYRYLLFDNPTGDEIYADFMKNASKTGPTLLARGDDMTSLREKVQKDPQMKEALSSLLLKCETHIKSEPQKRQMSADGYSYITAMETVYYRVIDLATAWIFTGDDKYRERIWQEIRCALVDWEDWYLTQFLAPGNMAAGVAIGYDIIKDYISEEDRQLVKDKFCEKYLDSAVGVYNGDFYFKGNTYNMTHSNWCAIVGSGLLLSALSFIDEDEPDSLLTTKCKFIAEGAIKSLQYGMGQFYPSGATPEGIHYHQFFTRGMGISVKTMLNTCGSDYGFLKTKGAEDVAKFTLYLAGFSQPFNYADQHLTAVEVASEAYLYPSFYGNREEVAVIREFSKNYGIGLDAIGLLWYEPSEYDKNVKETLNNYPKDHTFTGMYTTILKGNWLDPNAAYVGIVGGKTDSTGSHFDKGSFIYEKDNVRWFEDLGGDNYQVEGGYNGTSGETLYIKRTEGHNSIVIDPSKTHPGQNRMKIATCEGPVSKERGAISVYNLQEMYAGQTHSYKRGFYLGDHRNSLTVQDEIELVDGSHDVYSFLTTKGEITISADGKSAYIEKDGKRLNVSVICDAASWHLEKRDATYIFPEMQRSNENDRSQYKKITLVARASGKLNISMKFTMANDGIPYEEHKLIPITEWTIPDGEMMQKPQLDSISINGSALTSFTTSKLDYKITLSDTSSPAKVSATSESGTVTIKQPVDFYDNAVITVTSKEGLFTTYTINFEYQGQVTEGLLNTSLVGGIPSGHKILPLVRSMASYTNDPVHGEQNLIDGDIDTRWASNKSGSYATVDIGEIKNISGVALSWMSGNERTYKFDLLISNDGVNFTKVFSDKSLQYAGEYEFLPFDATCRYVRYVGYGHLTGVWNSVTELRPCTK